MEQTSPQLSMLEFELSSEYPPSREEIEFYSKNHKDIIEELKKHGFIDNKLKPLAPFKIQGKNEILGPNEEGRYIVYVQYIRE